MKFAPGAAGAALLFALVVLSCATAPTEAVATIATSSGPVEPAMASGPGEATPVVLTTDPSLFPLPAFSTAGLKGAGAPTVAAIGKSAELALRGDWKTGWEALAAADPGNLDPWILAARIELALEGRTGSMLHQQFSLVDLQPDETLEFLRASDPEIQPEMLAFDPAALVLAQAGAGIVPSPSLDRAMARYWYEIASIYGEEWVEESAVVIERALEAFGRSREAGLVDVNSLGQEAELLLGAERPEEAETLLGKAIELDPSSTDAHANRAIARYYLGRYTEALVDVDAAILTNRDESKSLNLFAMGAQVAADAKDPARSEFYLASAEKRFPDDPTPGLFRHSIAVASGDAAAADKAADEVNARFPGSPYVIRALISAWIGVGDPASSRAFLARALAAAGDDAEAQGGLLYYDCLVILQGSETYPDRAGLEEALGIIGKAEECFKTVYPPEHDVFASIEQIRADIALMMEEDAQGGATAVE